MGDIVLDEIAARRAAASGAIDVKAMKAAAKAEKNEKNAKPKRGGKRRKGGRR